MLAQLQFGKVHLLASQEYPAASLLDNGRDIPPSCASTAGNRAESNQMGRMVKYYSNLGVCFADNVGIELDKRTADSFRRKCGQTPEEGVGTDKWTTDLAQIATPDLIVTNSPFGFVKKTIHRKYATRYTIYNMKGKGRAVLTSLKFSDFKFSSVLSILGMITVAVLPFISARPNPVSIRGC